MREFTETEYDALVEQWFMTGYKAGHKDGTEQDRQRLNDLEVKLDNLRVQFDNHDHPYKPEPRYGGR